MVNSHICTLYQLFQNTCILCKFMYSTSTIQVFLSIHAYLIMGERENLGFRRRKNNYGSQTCLVFTTCQPLTTGKNSSNNHTDYKYVTMSVVLSFTTLQLPGMTLFPQRPNLYNLIFLLHIETKHTSHLFLCKKEGRTGNMKHFYTADEQFTDELQTDYTKLITILPICPKSDLVSVE